MTRQSIRRQRRRRRLPCGLLLVLAFAFGASAAQQVPSTLTIRGHVQSLVISGSVHDEPIIVASGDGGWMHLAPHVADVLSAHGFFVIGFDTRAYLESFTDRHGTLRPEDEPGDFHALAQFAKTVTGRKPILVGVSEGAGLAVLAATDRHTKDDVVGVVGLGLPDINELAWRWKDAVIYLTHRVPNEPTFSTAAIVNRMAPLPLAAIHSTHDEFVSMPDVQRILANAGEPKRLWIVPASNHRFSDNLGGADAALLQAIAWVKAQATR